MMKEVPNKEDSMTKDKIDPDITKIDLDITKIDQDITMTDHPDNITMTGQDTLRIDPNSKMISMYHLVVGVLVQ